MPKTRHVNQTNKETQFVAELLRGLGVPSILDPGSVKVGRRRKAQAPKRKGPSGKQPTRKGGG